MLNGILSLTLFVGCHEDDLPENQYLKGDVLLYSQNDVNSFVDKHKNIQSLVIAGKLIIGSPENKADPSDIQDISGLSNIVEVIGKLQIGSNPRLPTTKGLQNIRSVGDLNINRNENLVSLTFDNLESVHGQFVIFWNKSITSLDGFFALTSIGSYFNINLNESLMSLNGLGTLDTLRSMDITNNSALADISVLTDLVWVKEDVVIDGNPSLSTLSGLENLQYVGGDFLLDKGCLMCGNENLKEIRPVSLTFIGGDCKLSNNMNAAEIDFTRLKEIQGSLELNGFTQLSQIDGFERLSRIGGDLSVKNNQALIDLDGFSNLNFLGGYLRVHANPSLESMRFGSLAFAKYISVVNNPGIVSFDGFFGSGIVINIGIEISRNNGLTDLCSLKPLIERAKVSATNPVTDIFNNGSQNQEGYTNDYLWIEAKCN